jgi:hypothetical protein
LTTVLVAELGLAMNENVFVTALVETSALAVPAPTAATAQIEAPTAIRRRSFVVRFIFIPFPWLGHAFSYVSG